MPCSALLSATLRKSRAMNHAFIVVSALLILVTVWSALFPFEFATHTSGPPQYRQWAVGVDGGRLKFDWLGRSVNDRNPPGWHWGSPVWHWPLTADLVTGRDRLFVRISFWPLAVFTLLLMLAVRLLSSRAPAQQCTTCGYDLRGLPAPRERSQVCPECGGHIPRAP